MPSSPPRPAVAVLLVFALSTLAVAAPGPAGTVPDSLPPSGSPAPSTSPKKPGPLILEDVPEPLVPKESPDQEQRDRLEALAMFSAGRMLEQQEKYPEALRLYERAFRYDPKAVSILRAIVPLAYQLERHAEAVRYALKLVELENADPLLLNQLGTYLTELGDWQGAVNLYERATAGHPPNELSAAHVVLRMQMGRLYHLLGNYEKASECFAQVLEALDNPEQHGIDDEMRKVILGDALPTYSLMGEAFLEAKRSDDAAAAFQKADKLKPSPALLSYRMARIDFQNGKPELTLEKLQPYLEEHLAEEGLEPYELLAGALAALDRSSELLSKLESLHAADGENVPLGYFLAEKYREAGQLDKAEPLFRSLLERAPATFGYRNLAEIYRTTNRPDQLLAVLGQVIDKTSSLEALGEEAEKLSGDPAAVLSLIDAARRQYQADPKHFEVGRSLAIALLAHDAKQFDASAEFFDRAIQMQPDRTAPLLLTWGLGLLVDEQYARAAAVFRRGVEGAEKDDEKAVLASYLASALEMEGQTQPALEAARKAVELKPDVPRFHARIGWVYYHAQQLDDASKTYGELIERFGSQYGVIEVRQSVREARLVLSNIAVLQKKLPEAEEYLELVLDEFPDDVAAMNDLGYLWADQNKHLQRALRMLQTAVQADPENTAYRDSLGWVFFRLGRKDEAVVELEKATKDESDPVIYDHLGDAYLVQGHPEKALQAWQKAVEGFKERKENDTLQKVEQKIRENQK